MRFLGWIGYTLLLCATAAMAGSFAYATGLSHGPEWAKIFAVAVGALLAAESMLAASKGNPWLRVPAIVVTMFAVLSMEIGFAASVFSDARAIRADQANAATAARVVREPATVIRIRLEAHEGANPGIRASWCGAKSDAARVACEKWTTLRADMAAAETVEKRGPAQATGDADARAALLARVFGFAQPQWADWLIVLLAVAMSLARVACAAALLGEKTTTAQVEQRISSETARLDVNAETPEIQATQATAAEIEPETPQHVVAEPADVAPIKPARPATVSKEARKVLRVVTSHAQPASEEQGFAGFIPPGVLSQRTIATEASMSRRQAVDALEALQAAGYLETVPLGREGTEYRLLKAV